MGIFSNDPIVTVASTVYNLAGDTEPRPNFLKNTIFSAVMAPNNVFIGEAITTSLLTGPGITQRSYHNWAVRTSFEGLPTFTATRSIALNPATVLPYIPVPASPSGLVTVIQTADIQDGDFSSFAEDFILDDDPAIVDTNWTSDYNLDTHEITIQYEGGGTDVIAAGIYDGDAQFIVVRFYQYLPTLVGSLSTGTLVEDVYSGSLPDLTGYTEDSVTNTGIVTHTLITDENVLTEYSDATPTTDVDTLGISTDVDYNGTETISSIEVYQGGDTGGSFTVSSLETFQHIFEYREIYTDSSVDIEVNEDTPSPGVTQTITTTITGDFLRAIYDYRTDTQETESHVVNDSEKKMFIYKIGSGTAALDALQTSITVVGSPSYFPFIPMRLDNVSITHATYDSGTGNGLYEKCNQAFRRALPGQHFDKLVANIEADPNDPSLPNPDLGDIDYAYIMQGVPLNATESAAKNYIYEFLLDMENYQSTTSSTITDFITAAAANATGTSDIEAWRAAQLIPSDPLYDTARPTTVPLASLEYSTIRLKSSAAILLNYDIRIEWVHTDETQHAGLYEVGAETGDIKFETGTSVTWTTASGTPGSGPDGDTETTKNNTLSLLYVYKQISASIYRKITIYGLQHRNYIYMGKDIKITAYEALNSGSTDPSGFLFPLNYTALLALPLKDSTQLALSNTYILFNTYDSVKQKWYESFLGQLVIVVAIVIVSVLLTPATSAGVVGVLGANSTVGVSLGFASGTLAATIAGAVANAIAAVVLTRVISAASIAVFGEKWGPAIGAIVSFVVSFGLTSPGGFSGLNLDTLFNPSALLKISSALANGYEGFSAIMREELNIRGQESKKEFDTAMEEIKNLTKDLMGGTNDLSFNPMSLTSINQGNESSSGSTYTPESLDGFIHRTTLTGTEIVDITLSLITDYPELSLQLPETVS